MARLVKNIDTRDNGPLKVGRLLNGLLSESKIAELVASGHAIATEDDESHVDGVKVAENASGESESVFDYAYLVGYATAINDAVDSDLITPAEASTCIFQVEFDDESTSAAGAAGESTSAAGGDVDAGAAGDADSNAPAKGVTGSRKVSKKKS